MSFIVLDFETYYDAKKNPYTGKAYSLRSITPVEYLHDTRFECTGCAIIDAVEFGNEDAVYLWGNDLVGYFKRLRQRQKDGEKLKVVSHNALFDMCVLCWKFGLLPDLMIDTMAMARALVFAFTGSVSLEKVAEHLGLPPKGTAIKNASGMTLAMLLANPAFWQEYQDYAKHDAWLCWQIFKILLPKYPADEFIVMDMVIRCAVVPRFKLNSTLLAEHKANIEAHKQGLLARVGMSDNKDLMSNDKFADALRLLNIDPPMKISSTTGKETYAFAKSDPDMVELLEHPDPRVQALVNARVGHKSTLEETRTQKLLNISMIQWPGSFGTGWSPIALRVNGAHTLRLSGDWGLNAQNWPKYTVHPDGSKETGKLRMAHEAPPGYTVVKADASQIEARIVAWLAGQLDLVEAFRDKRDIYSEFAEQEIFHYPVDKSTVDERFVGKNTILGAGFGMGAPKFKTNVAAVSFTALGRSIIIDVPTANAAIGGYRKRFPMIPKAWKFCNNRLPEMTRDGLNVELGPVTFQKEQIQLPNGLWLYYPELHWEPEAGRIGGGSWVCRYGKKRKYLFGGKIYENIVQALAKIITMDTARRMRIKWPKVPLAHQIHDDLIYIVRDDIVPDFKAALEHEMTIGPGWTLGGCAPLPLASEAAEGPNYGACK